MLAIKLSRTGKKNYPYFRLVVVDKQKDPWGRILENVGNYNPRTKETQFNVERIKFYLGRGAQPTTTIYNLFVSQGIISGHKKRISKLSKKRKDAIAQKEKTAKAEAEKKAAAEAKPVEEKPAAEATPQA